MKLKVSAFYVSLYLLSSYSVVWFCVTEMNAADPKLEGEVGLYYSVWTLFYIPIALMGLVFTLKRKSKNEMILAGIAALLGTAITQLLSFLSDSHWPILLIEYTAFGLCFWGISYILKTNSDPDGVVNSVTAPPPLRD